MSKERNSDMRVRMERSKVLRLMICAIFLLGWMVHRGFDSGAAQKSIWSKQNPKQTFQHMICGNVPTTDFFQFFCFSEKQKYTNSSLNKKDIQNPELFKKNHESFWLFFDLTFFTNKKGWQKSQKEEQRAKMGKSRIYKVFFWSWLDNWLIRFSRSQIRSS